jgi:hypothetical protein
VAKRKNGFGRGGMGERLTTLAYGMPGVCNRLVARLKFNPEALGHCSGTPLHAWTPCPPLLEDPMLRTLAAALLLSAAVPAIAQKALQTRQVGTATLQNVPEIPDDVRQAVQRYQNYRDATFEDWLPDGSMLIGTRFGATRQIHRVAAPGAARTQLTFFNEPVSGAWTIPGTSRYLFSRDTGGDEWFQLYAAGLTGDPVAFTEPGTRNQAPVFSKDGRRRFRRTGGRRCLAAASPTARCVLHCSISPPARRRSCPSRRNRRATWNRASRRTAARWS